MIPINSQRRDSLAQWSATAFGAAAGLFLVNGVVETIQRYTAVLGDPTFLNVVMYLSALVLSVVGLLGFYQELAERTPRLARVSAGVATLAGAALVVLLIWASITTLLNQPLHPGMFLIGSLAGIVLGFLLFTVASLRTGVPSRTIGRLLLAFVATWIAGLTLGFVVYGGDAPEWLPVALNGVSGLICLAIGYVLRTKPVLAGQAEPAPEATTK